ncbi:uncharacterized protein METZ01_LOCUS99316 [marine metagenome]|uniref:Uncharacterized protein n=1 Tax=marine metagenome TaxID=408172 RepID=A0A381W1X0_9ZZZZ
MGLRSDGVLFTVPIEGQPHYVVHSHPQLRRDPPVADGSNDSCSLGGEACSGLGEDVVSGADDDGSEPLGDPLVGNDVEQAKVGTVGP